MDASKIRLTDPPAMCSACFGQYPDRQHIDFGASWDGPMFPADDPRNGAATAVSIDELVICEECLKAAADELGLVDPIGFKAEMEGLAARTEELAERYAGAMAYIESLEDAAADRGKLADMLKPKPKTQTKAA